MEYPTPSLVVNGLRRARPGIGTRRQLTLLLAITALSLGALSGCSSGSAKPAGGATQSSAASATHHDQDSGPPPGTLLTAAQLQDPIPRSEPPSRYGNPASYKVFGKRYTTIKSAKGFRESGLASWYGTKFHGRRTSSGEPYDMYAMTAAHKSLPLPTYVEVKNLDNGRSAIVRVNDRGPFHRGRIIDLSYAAAVKLGVNTKGTARVTIRALTDNDRPATRSAQRDSRTVTINMPMSAANAATTPARQHPHRVNGDKAGLFLQVGAFSSRGNAEQLRSRLVAANVPNPSISEGRSANRTVYRLRIGPLASRDQADALLPSLAEVGIHNTRLLEVAVN